VQWKHFGPDEATWEMEDVMKHAYLILFTSIHAGHVDILNIKEDGPLRGREL
jgi:hypothetical protein